MGLIDHINNLGRLKSKLDSTRDDDALLTSLDAIALLKLRLAEGESADGSPFSDYSKDYEDFRREKGLQTGAKDFNVTGQLYASIQPEVVASSSGSTEVAISPRGEENKAKVRGANHYKGDIVIALSESELDEVFEAWKRRRQNRVRGEINT